MGLPSIPEMLIIFLVVLLLFGAKRIPEIARGLGRGIREFKDATTDITRELQVNNDQPRVQAPRHETSARPDQQREPAARPEAGPRPEPLRREEPATPDTEDKP
jgi:sec-independent protein translocase protein TatA